MARWWWSMTATLRSPEKFGGLKAKQLSLTVFGKEIRRPSVMGV